MFSDSDGIGVARSYPALLRSTSQERVYQNVAYRQPTQALSIPESAASYRQANNAIPQNSNITLCNGNPSGGQVLLKLRINVRQF